MRAFKLVLTGIIIGAAVCICAMSVSADSLSWSEYEAKCWINNAASLYEEYKDIAAGTDFMYDEEEHVLALFQKAQENIDEK